MRFRLVEAFVLQGYLRIHTVDDTNPALQLRTSNYGNYGRFLIMGKAGFISSTVSSG